MSPITDDVRRKELNDERMFVETLLNTRFNFFLIFFSLILAGYVQANEDLHKSLLLTIGAVVCSFLSLTIARSQQKMILLFKQLPDDHPAIETNKTANQGWLRFSVVRLLGYYIPLLCSIILITGAILSWHKVL